MSRLVSWRYCPVCGGELVRDGDGLYGKCGECGRSWYKNSIPTVSVIIYDKDNPCVVLMSRRGIEPKKGALDVVGGFVDFGESPEEAIKREVLEEVGVELSEFRFLGHFFGDDYVYQDRVLYCLDSCFIVGVDRGIKFKPMDDVVGLEWVDLKERVPELAFLSNRKGLRAYIDRFC